MKWEEWEDSSPFGYKNSDKLIEQYKTVLIRDFDKYGLEIELSDVRIRETFSSWKNDLTNPNNQLKNQEKCPDHIKCAGYLMFWLRRNLPITQLKVKIDFLQKFLDSNKSSHRFVVASGFNDNKIISTNLDSTELTRLNIADPTDWKELPADKLSQLNPNFIKMHGYDIGHYMAHKDHLECYTNEFSAWDFCYRLAEKFEKQKRIEAGLDAKINHPSLSYIYDFSKFLKLKNVSPHALTFVLRALLQENR